jgi:hypothetical protein
MISKAALKRQAIGFAGEEAEFRATRRAVANAKLAEYRNQCWRLANLARRGIVQKSNAVDLLFEGALGHALVRSLGEERITAIIAEAFADSDFRPMASEVA